jgi:peptide/nickel transport system substrate-binding protein
MRRRTLLKCAGMALLPLPAIGQSTRASTLRLVPQANLSVLDPVVGSAGITSEHGFCVFDTLYAMGSGVVARPQMAEGHSVENNGRTWLIKLRPGLKFHDGEPVRATDCVASLARWSVRDPFGQLLRAALDTWDAADDRTIRIRLKRPFPHLLKALAKLVTPPVIMPERLARTDPAIPVSEMIGSGPFRFLKDEFVDGSFVAYARFDGYVPRDEPPDWLAGGRKASFERMEWHIIPDPATVAAALRKGEVDWWELGFPDLLPALARDPNLRVQLTDTLGLYSIMRLNTVVPPFNNPRLRRALLEAMDQNDFMLPISGGDPKGYRTCYAMLPCGLPHTNEIGAPLMTPPHDLARARAAIRDSGYNGEKVVILSPSDYPSLSPLCDVMADLMKKLGMTVDLQDMDWGTVAQRRSSTEPVERGGWSMFPTNGSPLAFPWPPLNTFIRGQGAKAWFGWYDNPEIERLIAQWLDSPDAELESIEDAIQRSAFDSPPSLPLGQYFPHTVYRREITGIQQFYRVTPWTVRRA